VSTGRCGRIISIDLGIFYRHRPHSAEDGRQGTGQGSPHDALNHGGLQDVPGRGDGGTLVRQDALAGRSGVPEVRLEERAGAADAEAAAVPLPRLP